MRCQLLTLGGPKYDGDFTEVLLTTAGGMMVVLPHHEALTATVPPGPLTIHNGGQKDTFAIFGGIVEVKPDGLRILADVAEHSDELVQSEIEHALAEAERMRHSAVSDHELHHAQTLIDRQQVRLDVLKIRRNRHHRNPKT